LALHGRSVAIPDSILPVKHDQIHRRYMDCSIDQISPETAVKRFLISILVLCIAFTIAVIFGMGNYGQ